MKTKTNIITLAFSMLIISSCGFNKMPKSTDRMADTTDRMATTTEKMALSTDENMAQMNKNFEKFTELAPLLKELLINFNKMTPEVQQMLSGFNGKSDDIDEMMDNMAFLVKDFADKAREYKKLERKETENEILGSPEILEEDLNDTEEEF